MTVRAIRTEIFKERQPLEEFIFQHVPALAERAILVITSKIVALSEGRVRPREGKKEKDALIKAESDFALETKLAWLTIKDGLVLASAGIDESNGNGKLILLPKDSFKAAEKLRKALMKKYGVRELGVLITDSRLFPLRGGVVGVAVGYAGFKGVRDCRGEKDIFGRKLSMTQVDVADSLATAAVLEMGEGNERQPLAVIEEPRAEFVERVERKELVIDIKNDLYRPLFEHATKL